MTVYTVNGMTQAQTAQADEERTKRAFVGFLSSALGIDQNYAGEDSYIGSAPDQYVIANPDGSFSVQGRARSSLQSPAAAAGLVIPPGLLLLGGLLFFLARK